MDRETSGGSVLLFAVAMCLGIFLCRNPGLNQPAPGFSLPEAFGGRVELENYRGQPLLLLFWTTSCGFCRAELPILNRLAPEFQHSGIAVVTIHLGDSRGVREYLSSNAIDLTSLLDADGEAGQAYHVSGVPRLVLIGSDGKIRRSEAGLRDENALREWIQAVSPS
jgi:peroxiredoxin